MYVEVANRNLLKIEADMFGNLSYRRGSTFKPKVAGIPRKQIENSYMSLCIKMVRHFMR